MREEIPRKFACSVLNKERGVESPLLLIDRHRQGAIDAGQLVGRHAEDRGAVPWT